MVPGVKNPGRSFLHIYLKFCPKGFLEIFLKFL